MATFTSKAAGNWSASGQTTWNEVGVPGNGDTVTISHAIAVDANTTVGSSPAAGGTAAIAVNSPGSLTINAGITLISRGDIILASSPVTMAAGSILEFDASQAGTPSTALYVLQIGTAHNQTGQILTVNGTVGSRCTVRSNAGGGNGRITDGGFLKGGQINASYCDFLRLGDASNKAFAFWLSASGNKFNLQHCTLTSCGQIQSTSALDVASNFLLSDVIFTGTVASYCLQTGGNTPLTGTRTVNLCSFDKNVNFFTPAGFTITNSYFAASFATTNGAWASFSGNLIQTQSVGDAAIGDSLSNCYWIRSSSGHGHLINALAYDRDMTIDGVIFEGLDTSITGDDVLTSNPTNPRTVTIQNCIKLPNAAGTSSGTMFSSLGGANTTIAANHNTIHGGGAVDSSGMRYGETYTGRTGLMSSIKSNLYWDTTAQGYLLCALSASAVADAVAGADCDYNGKFNAATGTHNTVNGVGSQSLAGYENIDITVAPDAHGVTDNPNFVDSTRNLATWGSITQGTGGTAAQALAVIAANPALIYDVSNSNALWQWVRAGFAPTNAAFHNTAHDGGDIGAVPFVAVAADTSNDRDVRGGTPRYQYYQDELKRRKARERTPPRYPSFWKI